MVLNREWRPFLGLLLAIEIAYVLVEFSFNAAILNVASGAAPGGIHAIDHLEFFGRALSGIGLGLFIFTATMLARAKAPGMIAQLLVAALIFPPSIVGMGKLQTWLVYDLIPAQSDDNDRFAAT